MFNFVKNGQIFADIVDRCPGGDFFGFPPWYKYLKGDIPIGADPTFGGAGCTPVISGLSDVWLIVAAIIEILLRLAVFLSIGFVVYGGIRYVVSQGEPDRVAAAQGTIVNAIVGLVVSIVATAAVSFIAGRFIAS